jgi:hypothetical protein
LRALKVKLINLQDYPNNKDISHIESVVCDSAIVNDEGNPRVGEEVIKMEHLFVTLNDVKFFFQDYDVRHHQPYYVAKSNKGEHWGEPKRKYLLEQAGISNNEVVVLFDPTKLVYEVKSSSQTSVGGEVSGGCIFRVEINTSVCCMCMTSTLLHLPSSHVITAHHM